MDTYINHNLPHLDLQYFIVNASHAPNVLRFDVDVGDYTCKHFDKRCNFAC